MFKFKLTNWFAQTEARAGYQLTEFTKRYYFDTTENTSSPTRLVFEKLVAVDVFSHLLFYSSLKKFPLLHTFSKMRLTLKRKCLQASSTSYSLQLQQYPINMTSKLFSCVLNRKEDVSSEDPYFVDIYFLLNEISSLIIYCSISDASS